MTDTPEAFSNDIRWHLLAVSRDMMDTSHGNAHFPFAWRSSLAIYGAVPPPEEQIVCAQQTLYLKITVTITGYQPSKEETEQGYVQFPEVPIEEMDRILKEYFACYGAFLQVGVFPRLADTPLNSYPHIVDFEPKVRDLYQTATENGEILSASKSGVKTDRSFSRTEDSETGLDLSAALKFPLGKDEKGGTGEVGGKLSHKWGETDKDTWQVTADAARERRETTGIKTEISQMYNLLAGYHAGTNRAAFLMLPRPHILQPTDHRTFVQGLRVIEGVQDFFLIVQHPADMQGLCVDISLDTGHFPEHVNIQEPEEIYEETSEDFWVEAYAAPTGAFTSGKRVPFQKSVPAPASWVVDRRKGDPGHPGVGELDDQSNSRARDTLRDYDYGVQNDTTVSVSGSIKSEGWWGAGAIFKRKYRAHFRSEEPLPSSEQPFVATPFLVTNRRLGVCIAKQDDCFVEMPPDVGYWHDDGDWVVNELSLEIPGAVSTKAAQRESRTPLLKAALREMETALVRNGRLRMRYPYGVVNYLDSNYFLQQIAPYLPEDYVSTAIGNVAEIPVQVREALGVQTTVRQLLAMDFAALSRTTGMGLQEAIALKQRLLRRTG